MLSSIKASEKKSCANCKYYPRCIQGVSVWFAGDSVDPKNHFNHVVLDPDKFVCGTWEPKKVEKKTFIVTYIYPKEEYNEETFTLITCEDDPEAILKAMRADGLSWEIDHNKCHVAELRYSGKELLELEKKGWKQPALCGVCGEPVPHAYYDSTGQLQAEGNYAICSEGNTAYHYGPEKDCWAVKTGTRSQWAK